jgi:hypothetical protein
MKTTFLPLSDPDLLQSDLDAVSEVLTSPSLSAGPVVQQFEKEFAAYLSRKHAIAVASGTIGMLLALRARGIGPGDEVIASSHSFRETAHAIALCGARPVFADIDYWTGALAPEKAKAKITERTRAIIAGNTNGHPAPWEPLREVAAEAGCMLVEDSTEAIGSVYKGKMVGSFGDCSIFDFSQPSALVCGEGGMVVTDDDELASLVCRLRSRRVEERSSVVLGAHPPLQASLSDIARTCAIAPHRTAVGQAQTRRALVLSICSILRGHQRPVYRA